MLDQIGEDLSGIFLVISHLAAAIRMIEGDDIFQRTGDIFLSQRFHLLDDGIDAADRRNDPDLVTNTGLAVFSEITLKSSLFALDIVVINRLIGVVFIGTKRCLDVVGMDVLASCDIGSRITDQRIVFDDRIALFNIT